MIFMQMKFENHWCKQLGVVDELWIRMQQDKSSIFICQVGVEDGLEKGERLEDPR